MSALDTSPLVVVDVTDDGYALVSPQCETARDGLIDLAIRACGPWYWNGLVLTVYDARLSAGLVSYVLSYCDRAAS